VVSLIRPHSLLAALVAGLAFGPYVSEVGASLIAFGGLGVAAAVATAERRPAAGLAVLCLLVAGLAAGQQRAVAYDAVPGVLAGPVGFVGRGYVVERFRPSGDGWRARLSVSDGPARGARLELRAREEPVLGGSGSIGHELWVEGQLRLVADLHPDDDGYARWLRAEGVDAVLSVTRVKPTGRRRGGVVGVFDAIRIRAEQALASGLPDQPAALMRGMVLGGDEQFAPELRDDFRAVGLSHIVAVSGANVMLLAVLVAAVGGVAGIGRGARFWIALGCVCMYVPLCGVGASVVRAGVMGVAGLVATHLARPVSRLYLVLLAALALLLLNPRAAEDVGAQLSFAAVLGLMAFAGPIQRRLVGRWRLPCWLAEALAATASATIATLPVSAFHFGQVSLVSLAANVLAAPVIGPIVWLGSIEALVGQLAQWPATILNALSGFMLGYLIELAGALAALPGAQARLQLGWAGLLACGAAIVTAAMFVSGRFDVRGGWPVACGRMSPSRWRQLLASALALAALAGVSIVLLGGHDVAVKRPAIVFLDVGQGDAVLLLGSDGCEALIDGGPRGGGLARLLPRYGVDEVELVVATHPAADHHGGLLEAVEAGELRTATFLAGGLPSRDSSYALLRRRMLHRGARIGEAAQGARWSCGDISVDVVGPRPARPGDPPADDPNVRAAVVEATVGRTRLLTTSDAESPQVLPLPIGTADVLKVPHHGSEDDGLARLLGRVRPRVAVIQVGEGNPYDHPRQSTLRTLASVPVVRRTDQDGTVVVAAVPSRTEAAAR
jgi:competence protein ComEC